MHVSVYMGKIVVPHQWKLKLMARLKKSPLEVVWDRLLVQCLELKGMKALVCLKLNLAKDPSAHSKLLSAIFFKEFVIPAGKEVKVTNSIHDVTNMGEYYTSTHRITTTTTFKGCNGDVITFIAEAGKDYEVAPISSNRECGVTVYEIK